jgi:glycosyltransferase involved in cell wall biosynthesis
VRFHGRVDDPAVHTRAADLFVLPSLSEGISNALLEAMAQGLPCIATDIPGNRDLIRDGETGLLVPTGDPGALAQRIALLAGDEGLRASLGRAARRLVEVRFDIDSVAREYAALYRGLLARV